MDKYQLYLFDFDGTLFDTLTCSKWVFRNAYKQIGIELKEEDVLSLTREPISHSFKRLGASDNLWDTFIFYIDKYVMSHESVDLTEIYDDTYDTIIDLRMQEADLGIVTSNNAIHVKEVLKKFDLQNDFFSVFVGVKEAPTPKPSPEPILKALEMINYQGDKNDVCYIGDSLNDCKAAINAGVVPILLDRNDEYPNVPYKRIKSLKELLD